ncbi:hypothetical protein OROMI_010752 [Orobanche minor]
MDSGDFRPFSQSEFSDSSNTPHSFNSTGFHCQTPNSQSHSFVEFNQLHNGIILPNLQYQATFLKNPLNAQISSQPQQYYGPRFSYQGLLNTPNVVYAAATSQPSKVTQKRKKPSQNLEIPLAITNRRWTVIEDTALTNARLHVSCDGDVGTGQKTEALWSRILQVWRENMGEFDATRDSNALECRWGRLHAAISKFHGCFERLERNKKSGTSLEDVKRAAMRMYQDTNNNKLFKHEECWDICRKNVKWCTKQLTKQDAPRKQKYVVDSSNENSASSKETQAAPNLVQGSSSACVNDVTHLKTSEGGNTNDEGVARPNDGRKAIKDQKKKVFAEKSVADALGNLQSSLERQIELNRMDLKLKKEREKKDYELRDKIFNAEIELKEKNQKMKEKAYKRKEQERILEKDLTKLTPNVRKKYEAMQAQIIKEWEKDGFFGEISDIDDVMI